MFDKRGSSDPRNQILNLTPQHMNPIKIVTALGEFPIVESMEDILTAKKGLKPEDDLSFTIIENEKEYKVSIAVGLYRACLEVEPKAEESTEETIEVK